MENNLESNECISSRRLMEVILELLSIEQDIKGDINIETEYVRGNQLCVMHIIVPCLEYYNKIKTKIENNKVDILNKQILTDLINTFLDDETISISPFAENISIMNKHNSKLRLNFLSYGNEFSNLIDNYNREIQEHNYSLTKK